MSISDVTAPAVRAAMAQHDKLGAEAFSSQYDVEPWSEFTVAVEGRRYGSQALVAAAHGFLPGGAPLTPAEVADVDAVASQLSSLGFSIRRTKLPDWSRDELVLACALLFQNHRKALRATDPRVQQLSQFLRAQASASPGEHGERFRSPSSVQRKLYDLQTRLPEYSKARTRGGSMDEQIVTEFDDNESAMMAEAERIRARANRGAAWSLFSADGDRKYDGNDGYPDVLGTQYVYDSKVSNSRRVRVGDLVVLRGAAQVLGVSRVERIDAKDGVAKKLRVCPQCNGTRFDVRQRQRPQYRCRRTGCNHEFEQPRDTTTSVTQFVAVYGADYRPVDDGALSVSELKAHLLDKAPQNAIRPVDQVWASTLFDGLVAPPPEADRRDTPTGGHREGRTRFRIGQGQFRDNLLDTYGAQCAITGPCPEGALEAAHLESFAEHESHENGLLLRADVHKLFDRGLLAVHPDTLRVEAAPSLAGYALYTGLAGIEAKQITDREALRDHYLAARSAWKES